MDDIRAAIKTVLAADNPMTVRQVFYQLVVRGVIDKTEAAPMCRQRSNSNRNRNTPKPNWA